MTLLPPVSPNERGGVTCSNNLYRYVPVRTVVVHLIPPLLNVTKDRREAQYGTSTVLVLCTNNLSYHIISYRSIGQRRATIKRQRLWGLLLGYVWVISIRDSVGKYHGRNNTNR